MNATPESLPSALDIQRLLSRAWSLFASAPLAYLFAGLVLIVIGTLTLGLLIGPLVVGFIRMIDRHQRGETIAGGDIWKGMSSFGPALLTTLLIAAGVCLGAMLIVLPGVIVGFFTGYALYFVALRGLGPGSAIAASFELAKKHVGSVLLVLLAVVALNVVGGLVIVGSLVTVPLSLIMMTLSFDELAGRAG